VQLKCVGCGRNPEEISEYWPESTGESGVCAADYVQQNEGSLNPTNGHFWCTECYIQAGMPLGVAP
jgi:hypothetical protein